MLTTLLLQNLDNAGSAGGISTGAPVVSVGTTGTAGGGPGKTYRYFGASYEYNEPEVVAAREEIKILRKEKKKVKRTTEPAMFDAIQERLDFLYKLIEDRKKQYAQAIESYEYQARMEAQRAEEKVRKREKRQRRLNAIMKLLD